MYIPEKRLDKPTTIMKQVARGPVWLYLLAAVVVAAISAILVGQDYLIMAVVFVAVTCAVLLLIEQFVGFQSWIVQEKNCKYTLCIRDKSSRQTIRLPVDYITLVEFCEYSGFSKKQVDENYLYNSCHRIFNHWGYKGPGLAISYQLPRTSAGGVVLRSWRIPAPKAAAFAQIIGDNLVDRSHLLKHT